MAVVASEVVSSRHLAFDMPDLGNTSSFQSFFHPRGVRVDMVRYGLCRAYTRLLYCLQTGLHHFPFHARNFDSSSIRDSCQTRCCPKSRFGPIQIGDGNVRFEFPFLAGLFDDLARMLQVIAIVFDQSLLRVTGSLSDFV